MSQVAISGNASGTGTLTIAAPNTNSNYTLTLPTGTGAFNISGVVNEVPAGTVSAPSIYPTGDTNTGIFFPAADIIAWSTGGSERMRINSNGKILFNTTTQNNNEQVGMVYSSNAGVGFSIKDSNAQSGNTFIEFRNGTTVAGTITSNGTTTMTYGSASDYRLKENLVPLTGALAKLVLLQPKVGNWKVDGSEFVGFVAHELQEVFPDAVVGEKDRVDANGNALHQMVDTGSASIIATLTAAIQEQQAIIQQLQSDVAELKGATP